MTSFGQGGSRVRAPSARKRTGAPSARKRTRAPSARKRTRAPSARKRRRLIILLLALLGLGTATALALSAFRDNLVFFYSPTDLMSQSLGTRTFRLGGLVEKGSLQRAPDGVTVRFVVTDKVHSMPVTFKGILPDLFREGQGVVAEGHLDGHGVFIATDVLAKHDATYMPPEVAKALGRAGTEHVTTSLVR